ncbi:MAG: hypothetical protein WCD70_10135 [Alphaproteobacteria bacterium]
MKRMKIPYSKLPQAWEIDQMNRAEQERIRRDEAANVLHVPMPMDPSQMQINPNYEPQPRDRNGFEISRQRPLLEPDYR